MIHELGILLEGHLSASLAPPLTKGCADSCGVSSPCGQLGMVIKVWRNDIICHLYLLNAIEN